MSSRVEGYKFKIVCQLCKKSELGSRLNGICLPCYRLYINYFSKVNNKYNSLSSVKIINNSESKNIIEISV